MQTIVSFILLISVLVFIHELGHFIFAKRAGILVREFAIGFGPKLISWFRGETLYSIRLLPLGGYVRMAGEDPEIVELKTGSRLVMDRDAEGRIIRIRAPKAHSDGPTDEVAREYGEVDDYADADLPRHLPPVKDTVFGKLLEADIEKELYLLVEDGEEREVRHRIHPQAVIQYDEKNMVQIAPLDRQFASKSILDRALTILAGPVFNFLLAVVLMAVVTLVVGLETKVSIQDTVPNSPAERAGIQPGDIVKQVEGKDVNSLNDIRLPLQEAQGKPVSIVLERANQTYETTLKPEKKDGRFMIGIQMKQELRDATISEAAVNGFKQTYELAVVMVKGISQLVTGKVGLENLAGPVGIADITGQAAEAGWLPLVRLAALLSLNLGILNILPFPALDGGRLMFILVEALRGKPLDPNKESLVHFVGFALLMMLMLFITYNDILRVFFS
ncbi:regulator of sigma E protease [Melghirimyces profundicolus]|uniref:Zinc metalloprotease n=1 Tax=Melghirimyces profundicolus TaxID=1242148 RepID=A0A2T6BRE0_9BACL|nr:RIP metalloprotease RseP [Melghirimyces profundicolus]PTX58616.1 regulator of sigma E protease [Melghirimyces profundicolus]